MAVNRTRHNKPHQDCCSSSSGKQVLMMKLAEMLNLWAKKQSSFFLKELQ